MAKRRPGMKPRDDIHSVTYRFPNLYSFKDDNSSTLLFSYHVTYANFSSREPTGLFFYYNSTITNGTRGKNQCLGSSLLSCNLFKQSITNNNLCANVLSAACYHHSGIMTRSRFQDFNIALSRQN